ncbi:efflux transporter outer membrane subunit [Sphingobacterium sp. SYP-B4668]|uniref:efflux transporter outer membrane subunit n=1 Tax=Sphingobacterium sp. SYP-B4668 TaxID=2996035 RepID=UPI0022DDCD3A|nr:TolC family protein [Sphingobacterium sp. SYP-B4668]
MNIKINIVILLFLSTIVVLSCQTKRIENSLHPPFPEQYRGNEKMDSATNLADVPWQDFFHDTILKELIDTAIRQNMDMQLAVKNIEASQLMIRQAKAAYLPSLQLQVNANSTNPSNNSLNGLSLGEFLKQNHIEDYNAALSLSWEADIWGKIRNQNAAALARYLQTAEAKKAVQTQLVAQVAQGYYQLLMLYQLHEIAIQNLNLSDSTLRIVQHQYDVGDISLLAVEQVTAQKLAAAALIPDFEQQIQIQENAISILSGKLPQKIQIQEKLNNVVLPDQMHAGIPAQLLGRRPDVKQAELAVTEALAYQQSARAKMYPSLVISAEAGVNAFKASNWFNIPASLFGAVTGSLTQPLLQRRQLKTQYELAVIEQEKSIVVFRQSVINAVGEVSDALISIEKLKEKHHIALGRTKRLQRATQHADLLFETGMATYLEVISAQSNVLQSELELAQLKKAELVAVVNLYRSLGGGWSNKQ